MIWVISGIAGVIGVLWALRWVMRTDAAVVAGVFHTLIRLILMGIGIFLSRGRFWLVGMLIRGLFFGRGGGRGGGARGFGYRYRSSEGQRAMPGQMMSLNKARQILQVGPLASEEEIQHAWRNLMRKAHPDMGGDPEDAVRINQARDILLKNR